jgi:hypothetical protein
MVNISTDINIYDGDVEIGTFVKCDDDIEIGSVIVNGDDDIEIGNVIANEVFNTIASPSPIIIIKTKYCYFYYYNCFVCTLCSMFLIIILSVVFFRK